MRKNIVRRVLITKLLAKKGNLWLLIFTVNIRFHILRKKGAKKLLYMTWIRYGYALSMKEGWCRDRVNFSRFRPNQVTQKGLFQASVLWIIFHSSFFLLFFFFNSLSYVKKYIDEYSKYQIDWNQRGELAAHFFTYLMHLFYDIADVNLQETRAGDIYEAIINRLNVCIISGCKKPIGVDKRRLERQPD